MSRYMLNSCILFIFLAGFTAQAQTELSLDSCLVSARLNYPLTRQKLLLQQQQAAQQKNLNTGYLPQANFIAQATYQNEVTSLPIQSPLFRVTPLDKDQYRMSAEFSQILFDGGLIATQKELSKEQEIADQSKIEQELYRLKERVTTLYLSALLVRKQLAQLALLAKI